MRLMKLARARAAFGLMAVATAAMLITPMLSSAQSAPGGAPAAARTEAQSAQAEFMLVQQELAQLEQEVLKDPAIRKEYDAVQAAIQEAARALDERHQSRVERLAELQQELQALTSSGSPSPEVLQPLVTEARGLQERVVAVQEYVARSEPLKTRITELRARMTARMSEIDPQAPQKLERLTVLAKGLSASGR